MSRPALAVVGASWGGLDAVKALLGDLRDDLTLAILIVQHRSPDAPDLTLARYLQTQSPLPLSEVQDKDPIELGHVYLAPPDYHVLIEQGHFALSLEAPVHYSRPSIDVSLETAADAYGDEAIAIVLTGANDDGAAGLKSVKAAGGRTYAQDPDTAERQEMPAAAIATGCVDMVLGIEEIASELNRLAAPS